jgi:hypothetical protein
MCAGTRYSSTDRLSPGFGIAPPGVYALKPSVVRSWSWLATATFDATWASVIPNVKARQAAMTRCSPVIGPLNTLIR